MADYLPEPVSATGGINATAVSNLLGNPKSDCIRTLLRESVQNSRDARSDRSPNGSIDFKVRLYTLDPDQKRGLFERMLQLDAVDFHDPKLEKSFAKIEETDELSILELSDYGTTGLSGIDKADVATDKLSNWASFVLNIGQDRKKEHGGGTYGYGKSSYHLASRHRIMCIYSRTRDENGTPVSRLIGTALTASFTADGRNYTGRHWWGNTNGESGIEPITGSDADDLAELMGMQRRQHDEFGTTFYIIEPDRFKGEKRLRDLQALGHVFREAMLVHTWPLMHPRSEDHEPAVNFELSVEHQPIEIPAPSSIYPFKLFTKALDAARNQDDESTTVLKRKAGDFKGLKLGRFNYKIGTPKTLDLLEVKKINSEIHDLFESGVHHVAWMRDVELIVKYDQTHPPDDDVIIYAGVLKADSEKAVAKAFSDSEPPAHDDWEWKNLEPVEKMFVEDAVKGTRKELAERFSSIPPDQSTQLDENGRLAALSDRLGEFFGIGAGRNAGKQKSTDPPTKKSKKNKSPDAILDGVGDEIVLQAGSTPETRIAEFNITCTPGHEKKKARYELRIGYAIDGGSPEYFNAERQDDFADSGPKFNLEPQTMDDSGSVTLVSTAPWIMEIESRQAAAPMTARYFVEFPQNRQLAIDARVLETE